jgi:hypothetical protein
VYNLILRESTSSIDSVVCCRTDIKNKGETYVDRQLSESEVTTEASDIYNVYYPVMEAQVVTDNNGKASETVNMYIDLYLKFLCCSVAAFVLLWSASRRCQNLKLNGVAWQDDSE